MPSNFDYGVYDQGKFDRAGKANLPADFKPSMDPEPTMAGQMMAPGYQKLNGLMMGLEPGWQKLLSSFLKTASPTQVDDLASKVNSAQELKGLLSSFDDGQGGGGLTALPSRPVRPGGFREWLERRARRGK